jgi:hypothetical protein
MPGKRRAQYAPMRIRCGRDDGTANHYALDVQLPVRLVPEGPGPGLFEVLMRLTHCACGARMVIADADTPEPDATETGGERG